MKEYFCLELKSHLTDDGIRILPAAEFYHRLERSDLF